MASLSGNYNVFSKCKSVHLHKCIKIRQQRLSAIQIDVKIDGSLILNVYILNLLRPVDVDATKLGKPVLVAG